LIHWSVIWKPNSLKIRMNRPNVSALVVRRVFKTDRQTLFAAFARADEMSRWFFPWKGGRAEATNRFEVGGTYQVEMFPPDGGSYMHTGEYKDIVPQQKIVFTWNSPAVKDTLVTIELHEVNGGTEVVLTHEFLPSEEAYGSHQEGWAGCLDRLDDLVMEKQKAERV
jgi:uncharacterized protein YndB with AHSA1/START domain